MKSRHTKLHKYLLIKILTKAKSFLILLFIISFNIQCFAQFLKEEKLLIIKERELLKLNKIKSKKTIIFNNDSTSKMPYKKWGVSREVFYDRNGNKLTTIEYDPEQLISDSLYYDSNNNIIKHIMFRNMLVLLYFYDDKNNLTKESLKDYLDSLRVEKLYKYDSLNNCIEELELAEDFKFQNVYLYDIKSNLIEVNSYHDNEFDGRTVNNYDNNSNLIESIYYTRYNEMEWIKIQKFNKDNKVIEFLERGYNGDTTIHVFYYYDKKGQLIKEISMSDDNRHNSGSRYDSIKKYQYDKQGLLIEKKLAFGNAKRTFHKVKFIYSKY